MISDNEIKALENLCLENRRHILEMVYQAQSGHIGGSLSSCEIMTVLFHKCMKHSLKGKLSADYQDRDRFVLSKGHVSPIYYSVLAQLGFIKPSELKTFRKLGTRLQGHPSLWCPGIEVATGSLGQGISSAVGMAIASKMDKAGCKVFCILGDGEIEEGQVWEACNIASKYELDNLCVIVDNNNLQIDGEIEKVGGMNNITEKFLSFGFNVLNINGHDISSIIDAVTTAKQTKGKPTAIIAKTIKGKGVSFMENKAEWHGKAPKEDEYKIAMKELED